jgi:hypothetical protein
VQAINNPINYGHRRTVKQIVASVVVVWVTSALISIPPLIGWNKGSTSGGSSNLYDVRTRQCQLTDDRGYVVYSAAGSFYIPLASPVPIVYSVLSESQLFCAIVDTYFIAYLPSTSRSP